MCFLSCGEDRRRLLDRLQERRGDRRNDRGEDEWKTDLVKVGQVKSDEARDDISRKPFSFGQSFLLEECWA